MQSQTDLRVASEKEHALNIAGSSTFGQYPKISVEQTYNMILSDGWLVGLGGYEVVAQINPNPFAISRGLFSSFHSGNFMLAVVGNNVYTITNNLFINLVGILTTGSGFVSIAENEKSEIAICDGNDIWIYNYSTVHS